MHRQNYLVVDELNSKSLKTLSVNGNDTWIPSIDLDTFNGNGIFFISTEIENSPIGSKAVWSPMLQLERCNRDTIRQVIFTKNEIYTRAYQDGSWNSWIKYEGTLQN